VDSITTSSTCCWISHSPNSCNCSGLLPYQRRSKLVFVFDFDVSYNHGQLLFMDINSGYRAPCERPVFSGVAAAG
jgi:hypothetical protein